MMEMKGDLKLEPVVESDALFALASRIRDDLPYGASMYNTLLMKARGYNKCFNYDVFTLASHPESHIVIWMREGCNFGLHCLEKETPLLVKAIEDTQLLPSKEKLVRLFHLPDYLATLFYEIFQDRHQGRIIKRPHHTFTYLSSQDYPLRCPEGMQLRRLGKNGVQHLVNMSAYDKDENVDHMCAFTANVPALGIYLDSTIVKETNVDLNHIDFAKPNEIPVAWITSHPYGTLGMLMTSEKYRRRGLGNLLTEVIARLQVAEGYVPHAHINLENVQSAAMFRKLPGWNVTHQATWIRYIKESEK